MGKAVPAKLSQRGAGFFPSPVRVRSMVGKVSLGICCQYIGLPLSLSF